MYSQKIQTITTLKRFIRGGKSVENEPLVYWSHLRDPSNKIYPTQGFARTRVFPLLARFKTITKSRRIAQDFLVEILVRWTWDLTPLFSLNLNHPKQERKLRVNWLVMYRSSRWTMIWKSHQVPPVQAMIAPLQVALRIILVMTLLGQMGLSLKSTTSLSVS